MGLLGSRNMLPSLAGTAGLFDNGRSSLVAQMVKNLPAMQETWVQSLDGEDPLEEEIATHSSILAWRIPGTEKPGGQSPWGHGVGHN